MLRLAGVWLIGAGLAACAVQPSPSLSPTSPSVPTASATIGGPSSTALDAWKPLFRPYDVPSMAADGSCPTTASRDFDPAVRPGLGTGPIYPVGFGTDGTAQISEQGRVGDSYPIKVLWLSTPSYRGIGLVHGEQIDRLGQLRFSGRDQEQVGALRLTLDSWVFGGTAPGSRQWNSYTWVRGPGCYAFRVEGETFSETIVFKVLRL